MSRIVLTVIVFSLLIFSNESNGQFIFSRTYGQSSINEGTGVVQGFDGGYVICGHTSTNNSDFYILKINDDGSLQWQNIYGGAGIEHSSGMIATDDSCYVIAGYSNGISSGGDYDFYVIKIDRNGQQLWVKNYGGTDWDFARSITKDASGNYIIAGSTYSGTSSSLDPMIIKIDANGNLIWEKIFATPAEDDLYSICMTDNGDFIATGYTANGSNNSKDIIAIRINSTGDSLFYRQHGSQFDEDAFNIINQHGRYMISGSNTDSQGLNNFSIRIDENGDSVNSVLIAHPGEEITSSVCQDGIYYMITGFTSSNGGGKKDAFVSRVDSIGTDLGGTTYGGLEDDMGNAILRTSDGGAIVVGSSASYGPGTQSLYVVKIDSGLHTGSLIIGIDENTAKVNLHIYYDSGTNKIFVVHPEKSNNAYYSICDIAGNEIRFSKTFENGKTVIQPETDTKGVYIFTMSGNGEKQSLKFMVR